MGLQMIYFSLAKYTTSSLSVKVLDLCFVRTSSLCLLAFVIAKYNQKGLTDVKKEFKIWVFARAIFGTFGYGLWIFAISNISLMISASI